MVDVVKVLLLAHDVSDAAIQKRISMLHEGGADVRVAGFRRSDAPLMQIAGCTVTDFGQTYNQNFLQRVLAVAREATFIRRYQNLFSNCDVIIARNLEMLALAVAGRASCKKKPALVYECLDIHRLLLGHGLIGRSLRLLEGWLSRHVSSLLTSSPSFIKNYFVPLSKVRAPIRLVENKVLNFTSATDAGGHTAGPPWVIGWFGIIRCRKSLEILSQLTRESRGQIKVVIRGKPALDQFEDFHKTVSETPDLEYLGPYKSPEDLADIYRSVHFTWAIDMYEEGLNSSWLLPNRLYEGGAYNAVPLALQHVATGAFLKEHNLGVRLSEPLYPSLAQFFHTLTTTHYLALEKVMQDTPRNVWMDGKKECIELVDYLGSLSAKGRVYV